MLYFHTNYLIFRGLLCMIVLECRNCMSSKKSQYSVEKRYPMINFDEEIAKFQPSLEVDQAEEAIFNNDLTDITDMIESILNEKKG